MRSAVAPALVGVPIHLDRAPRRTHLLAPIRTIHMTGNNILAATRTLPRLAADIDIPMIGRAVAMSGLTNQASSTWVTKAVSITPHRLLAASITEADETTEGGRSRGR